jgi:deoxyribodipyrimidine photolyase-related protein
MIKVFLVFPHQLFKQNYIPKEANKIFIVEEFLFFKKYNFHKQKIVFHRASMKQYQKHLETQSKGVEYIESNDHRSDVRKLIAELASEGVKEIYYIDVTDNWLQKRISETAKEFKIKLHELATPLFLTSKEENNNFFSERKKYFQTDYYTWQRKRLKILIDENEKPTGGKWTYDSDNRAKYPKNKKAPAIQFPKINKYYEEAIDYTEKNFANHVGKVNVQFIYPSNFEQAEKWLDDFLENRFSEFGIYEDAMVEEERILQHSMLTPMLNVGLLTPKQILQKVLHFAEKNEVPLNSLEGFVRQVIGWREFIRAVYEREGSKQRTTNYWNFDKKLPESFYKATTGIIPFDKTIQKAIDSAYCHHIERLMVLGNFMLLCEIHPNQVYKWFMEFFIDAYDWVMVPNVYGMTQFADGGLMCTKPYISGSNYIFKMSDYAKSDSKIKTSSGSWEAIWDGLFWRFMVVQNKFFSTNPRLGMLLKMFEKMPEEKQKLHLTNANNFLKKLNQ